MSSSGQPPLPSYSAVPSKQFDMTLNVRQIVTSKVLYIPFITQPHVIRYNTPYQAYSLTHPPLT